MNKKMTLLEQAAASKELIETGKMTLNEMRIFVGLLPLDDPVADEKLFAQSNLIHSGTFGSEI